MNKNYKCKGCDYDCSGMCAKDWEPMDANHQVTFFEWLAVAALVFIVFLVVL